MKHAIALVAVLAAGVAASFALAAPPPGKGPHKSTSTSTSPGKSGDHAEAKCRPMNLKGTVSGGTIALTVTKASGSKGKALVGTTTSLAVSGNVSVQAWDCSASGATTLALRQLHVGGSPHAQTTTP